MNARAIIATRRMCTPATDPARCGRIVRRQGGGYAGRRPIPILLLSGRIESATFLYERRGAGGLRAVTKTPLTILPLKELGKTLAPPDRLAPR